jgi:hypothetical protein
MISIWDYSHEDTAPIGALIADTYNLSFAAPEELKQLLGPFWYASSEGEQGQQAIAVPLTVESRRTCEMRSCHWLTENMSKL